MTLEGPGGEIVVLLVFSHWYKSDQRVCLTMREEETVNPTTPHPP
jgi:hypothetical protein